MREKGKRAQILKLFCLLIAAIMAITVLAACGESGNPSGGGGDETPDDKYSYGADHADVYDEAYTQKLLTAGDSDFTMTQLAATDGAGRKLTASGERIGGKYVGIFYFLWLGTGWSDIYDISKLQEKYADIKYDTVKNPLWANSGSQYYDAKVSPQNAFHYFEEPLYGYYSSDDKWVIKRHLEMLSLAGVDFLYLDFTNAGIDSKGNPLNLYQKPMYALLDCILEMRELGYDVPQVVPICCNNVTGGGTQTIVKVIEWVFNNYYAYSNYKYRDCWFVADDVRNPSGNPMFVAYDFDKQYLTDKTIADKIWLRNVVWPTAVTGDSYSNGFPWMDYALPQENYDGIMNVSVAQHIGGSWSSEAYLARSTNNTNIKYRGRGAAYSQKYAYETDSTEEALYGKNFEDQWKNVLSTDEDVWMVTVTGWNEWVAQKLNVLGTHATFVDTFDTAFSRDAEMMRDSDGYADNYYMQLATYIRKFKYADTDKNSNAAMWKKTSLDYRDLTAWDNVKAKYVDFTADAMNRNVNSVANVYTYTDNSARNDIEYVKIANDEEYLYVLAATADDITPYTDGDSCWMNIYLSTGAKGGWESYNYVINRSPSGGRTSIEKLGTANGEITTQTLSSKSDFAVSGNMISFRIPLEAIGVTSASEIQIKVCDNIFANVATDTNDGVGVYEFGNAMAFYCGGDSAPIGRLNYCYRMAY